MTEVAWKDKILDYEIEILLKKSTSLSQFVAWKDKILDYEIEMTSIKPRSAMTRLTWKDKILDYEIEIGGPLNKQTGKRSLKR